MSPLLLDGAEAVAVAVSLQLAAPWIAVLAALSPYEFVPDGPPKLAEAVAELAAKLTRAAASAATPEHP